MKKIKTESKILNDFLKVVYDFTVPELAERTGISSNTIISWKYQQTVPSLKAAEKLLNSLGYDLIIKKKNPNANKEKIIGVLLSILKEEYEPYIDLSLSDEIIKRIQDTDDDE